MHRLLDPLLARQHGVVTSLQCRELGLTPRQIEKLLSSDRLKPSFRGVLRDPAAPTSFEQRAMAAVLAGGKGAFVSHRMAVALWGMRNYRCDLAEITAPRKIVRPNLIAHRSTRTVDVRTVRHIPVSPPERTLLDCASVISTSVLARFIEAWLSAGVVKLTRLEEELAISNGHTGVGLVHDVLRSHDLSRVADSPSESALGALLIRHGLPHPELHHVVTLSSGAVYEIDWSYPDARVGLELDGYGVHLRSLDAFEHDRFRRNELEIEGWTIMNFSRRQVERRPKTVVDQVERMLRSRGSGQSTTLEVGK